MSFSSILGQEGALEVLRRLHEKKLRPSFLLFIGEPGVGRKKAAQEWAMSLLCAQPHLKEGACGECDSCHKANKWINPDITVVDFSYQSALSGKSSSAISLKVDTIREAIRAMTLRPYGSGVSVCIVDGAEALTPQAQNAALKILEESPAYLTWIWIVRSPEGILPTIQSRANFIVRFKPLPEDAVRQLLMEHFKAEAPQADLAARLSGGSLGTAARFLDNAPAAENWEGDFSKSAVFELSQRIARFRSYATARKAIIDFLEGLKAHFHWRWKEGGDTRSLRRLNFILKAGQDLDANVTPALILERLLLKMGAE